HNHTHHPYTNLKGRDYVWAPFSKAEFDALSAGRRLMERCYRTPLGVVLYYGVEIWWRRLFFAVKEDPHRRTAILGDSILCLVYGAALCLAAISIGPRALLAAVFWPFAVWNWLMGWAIFEHHTHPRVPWYANEAEWRAAEAQSRCTVHAVMPKLVEWVI